MGHRVYGMRGLLHHLIHIVVQSDIVPSFVMASMAAISTLMHVYTCSVVYEFRLYIVLHVHVSHNRQRHV